MIPLTHEPCYRDFRLHGRLGRLVARAGAARKSLNDRLAQALVFYPFGTLESTTLREGLLLLRIPLGAFPETLMKALELFEEVCAAMARSDIYPRAASRLERRDTHISAVFLTEEWVYKLKKPVDFGFLDFSNLAARKRFCELETLLNQRLSHDVYAGVVKISRDEKGGFSLDGPGEAVEYAVKMRRLPDEAGLDRLLAEKRASASDMEMLGRRLADFYEHSARNAEIDRYGQPEAIEFNMEENFEQVGPFVGRLIGEEEWEFVRQASRTFFECRANLFRRRVETGRIRDGHGDLRSEHIYFHDGIQIIDCIEFNDRFRYGDVVADLSFLHMDLEHRGRPDLSRAVLAAYAVRADDPAAYALLDFYATYRAIVKVKVACLRSTEVESAAEQKALKELSQGYINDAYRYAVQFSRPTLWVFTGLPATGKSSLAARVAEALDLTLLASDRIRDEMAWPERSAKGVVPYDQGVYRQEYRNLVYARMLGLAQECIKSGRSVILDATFSSHKWRDEATRLAENLDSNLLFVECLAGEETIRARLKRRESEANLSDARVEHLSEILGRYELLAEVPEEAHLRARTEQPFEKTFEDLLSEAYAKKCAQVGELLRRQE